MRSSSLARRLYMLLLPIAFMGLVVGVFAYRGLQLKTSDLVGAHRVKELAMTAFSDMLMQDDATKAMLLEPGNLDPAERKLKAYDDSIEVFKSMEQLTSSAKLRDLIAQMRKLDDTDLRPLDTEILEALGGAKPQEAISIYHKRYEPARAKYENLLREVGTIAEDLAKEATIAMTADNRKSLMAIGLVLVCGLSIAAGRLIWLVRQINRQLTRLVETVSANAAQTAAGSNQLSFSSRELAEGASNQAASLEESSASLEEMASMTKLNAEYSQLAKTLSNETRVAAETGSTDVAQMNAAMDEVRQASTNISKIIKTIDEIAFQTNILALNAAVEAARAGHAGLGFAVVAEEVRNLAQRSAVAARETAEMISNSVSKTERGVQLSGRVSQGLEAIVTKARKVDELVVQIASASNEQSIGIRNTTDSIRAIDAITQRATANADENSLAASNLGVQVSSLQQAAEDLRLMIHGSSRRQNQENSPSEDHPAPSQPAPSKPISPSQLRIQKTLQEA